MQHCLPQATVDAAHDLLQLLAEHPQLEALAADDRQLLQWRDTFVQRYREEATWLLQYPASRINWSDWMRQLLWNVLISECYIWLHTLPTSHTR